MPMRTTMCRAAALALPLSLSLFAACDANHGSDDRFERDSFRSPTEHGSLRFGSPNQASFSDRESFHSWTFDLSAKASFEIATDVSGNLDTVMFLYHRKPGSKSWGRFIAKNDDDGDSLGSRIVLKGAKAGEYRIKVKAAKVQQKGPFSVTAICDGRGCPPDISGSCVADEFAPLPTEAGPTSSCLGVALDVLTLPIQSVSHTAVDMADKCDLAPIEVKAVDAYHSFFDDIVGFEDQFPDEVTFFVSTTETEGGTIVRIDTGGDEDGMALLFGPDESLITLYQFNQSPTHSWFCETRFEGTIDAPDADSSCFRSMLFALPHAESEEKELELTTTLAELSADPDTDPRIAAAAATFAREQELDEENFFTLFARLWESREGVAGLIGFDGPGIASYYVTEDDREILVAASLDEEGDSAFLCEIRE